MTNKQRYLKNIINIFPLHTKKEKEYLQKLKNSINEFDEDYPNSSYDEFIDKFGSPKEIFVGYIESQEDEYLIKKLNTRKHILRLFFILCICILTLSFWKSYLIYKDYEESINHRITEVEILPPEEE